MDDPAVGPPNLIIEKKAWKTYAGRDVLLHEIIEFFIEDFKEKRNFSRDRANLFTKITICLGASLTIVLGTKSFSILSLFSDQISVLALVMSASSTALSSWIAFADHKWKWIRYRSTLSTLYTIRDDLRYAESAGKPLEEKDLNEFFDRLKAAVHETNLEWMSQRGNAISGLAPAKGK